MLDKSRGLLKSPIPSPVERLFWWKETLGSGAFLTLVFVLAVML